jgi:hypothetical protein
VAEKLTKAQRTVLKDLAKGTVRPRRTWIGHELVVCAAQRALWMHSWEPGWHWITLRNLLHRNLIVASKPFGFEITPAGRDALAKDSVPVESGEKGKK